MHESQVHAVTLRPARPEDAAAIAAIWNYEVLRTDATTDTEPRGLADQRAWIAAHDDDHPVVVVIEAEEIAGFGALAPYRPKPAFDRTVEDSVYVARGHRGRGIGSLILERLLEIARERQHHSVLARITAGNGASVRLHEAHGFHVVGIERETAFKLGRWLDVAVLQLVL